MQFQGEITVAVSVSVLENRFRRFRSPSLPGKAVPTAPVSRKVPEPPGFGEGD